jgi:hypothetical protein
MSLLVELDAFYLEHRRCGELQAGIEGPVVWMSYTCSATIGCPAEPWSGNWAPGT